jgi:hypothetical protein
VKHDIPANPNPALTEIAKGPQMRSLMFERGEIAQAIYREIVAKRSGRLARSARVSTFIGGRKKDRWVSRLTVGGEEAGYGASHEFDTEQTHGAHDLITVLNRLGRL